jgi:hypothetical protein
MTENQEKLIALKVQSELAIKEIEAKNSAREVASKYLGISAVPWIVLLVIVGVVASVFLEAAALPAVIGLVSTAVMAFISILAGITGTKDAVKGEVRPETQLMLKMLEQIAQKEPVKVFVEDGKVTVTKGDDSISTVKKE